MPHSAAAAEFPSVFGVHRGDADHHSARFRWRHCLSISASRTFIQKQSLGIEVNEAKVREMAAVGHRWRNPIWRTADGTIAEW